MDAADRAVPERAYHNYPINGQEPKAKSDPVTGQKTIIDNGGLIAGKEPTAASSKPLNVRRMMIFSITTFVYCLMWCSVGIWAPFFPGEVRV